MLKVYSIVVTAAILCCGLLVTGDESPSGITGGRGSETNKKKLQDATEDANYTREEVLEEERRRISLGADERFNNKKNNGGTQLRRGLNPVCDLGSFTISDLAGVQSPLFTLGSVSLQELIQEKFDQTLTAGVGGDNGFVFLPPRVICAEAVEQLSDLGESFEVEACQRIDFVNEVDIYAFGISDPENWSFCAAMSPETGTYALGQTGILPEAKLGGLTISLDAVAISLSKSLEVTTVNKMWDNTGAPAQIPVPGHVAIRGTGEIGFKASEKVKGVIVIDASVVIDADYNGDGIAPVLADNNLAVDFAILVAGKAGIKLQTTAFNKNTGKNDLVQELDLTTLVYGAADVYTVVNGVDTSIQIAASLTAKLQGICDVAPQLDLLCDIFDGNSGISGAIRSYANKGGFGLQFAVEGTIGLNSDFVEDIIGWPDDGKMFSATFSLGFRGDALYVCADVGALKWCWDRCSDSNECENSHFCSMPSGVCVEDRDNGALCGGDYACKSGFCVRGICSECPTLDSSDGCELNEFCGQGFDFGYRCETKRDLGAPCSDNNACMSNHCVGGFCSECPTLDSSDGCDLNEFCGQGFNFGYRCETKRGVGAACSSNNACMSNKCDWGFCVQCYRDGTGCSNSEYCDLGRCKAKLSTGSVCVENRVCKTNKCDAGFCVDCYRSGSGCTSKQYCDLGRCKTKLSSGSICVEDRVCMSGDCAWYLKCR